MEDEIRKELQLRILDIYTKLNDDNLNLDEKERERLSEELNRLLFLHSLPATLIFWKTEILSH